MISLKIAKIVIFAKIRFILVKLYSQFFLIKHDFLSSNMILDAILTVW